MRRLTRKVELRDDDLAQPAYPVPSKTFDHLFSDPHIQDSQRGDGYATLSAMAKFEAIYRYRKVMLEFFRKMGSTRVGRIGMVEHGWSMLFSHDCSSSRIFLARIGLKC